MLPRFLELALATEDIAAAVAFYESLGFVQLTTGDVWSHRYGVLTDGRLILGLHERRAPSPALQFVLPELQRELPRLLDAGLEPEAVLFGEEQMHQIALRDPGGEPLTLLEARTYSPTPPLAPPQPLLGYFSQLSLPQSDLDAARRFWELLGFVALAEEELPIPHLPLTSDGIDLALHQRRSFDAPLLMFECQDLGACLEHLKSRGITPAADLPRGLDRRRGALIEAPGAALLLYAPAS